MLRIVFILVIAVFAFGTPARAANTGNILQLAPAAPAAPAPANAACTLSNDTGDNQSYMPFPAQLKHGLNLSHWWDDDQHPPPTNDDLHQIHGMGFDYVRLPINPTWLEMRDPALQKKKLDQLRCDIISLLNQGLTVVLDLHPSGEFEAVLAQHPEDISSRLEKDWSQMLPVLEGLPVWRIYLELCSEPMLDSITWWPLQGKIIDDLRISFPNYTFIASPGPFDGWWDLVDRTPYKDLNVVYGFYFFEPAFFTRHGMETAQPAAGAPAKPPEPIIYPVDKLFNFDLKDPDTAKYAEQGWNYAALQAVVENIIAWRNHYNVGIVCLEFGVYKPYVDERSRDNWLRDAHKTMDDFNVPWTLWEYQGDFGLVDKQGVPDKGMMEALVLKESEGR